MTDTKHWTGRTLADDLSKKFDPTKWMTWVEVPLGSVVWHNGRLPRADVLAVSKSYSTTSFIIYEVKISRADYNSDINSGKYQGYIPYCSQLYFATLKGLVVKAEVPEDAGLIVRGDNGWRVVKVAPRREHKLDEELLLKLLMRGYENKLIEWKQYDRLKNLEYKGLKEAGLVYGIRIARDLSESSELIQQAMEIKEKIGELLGEKYTTIWKAVYALKHDVDKLLTQKAYASETMQLVGLVDNLLKGNRYSVRGTPQALRKIAAQIEAKTKAGGDEQW